MKQIKPILIFTLLLGIANLALAQNDGVYKTLHKVINVDNRFFFSGKFYEKALFFTINMAVNEKGVIDSVLFSDEKNEDLIQLFDLPKISRELKKNKTDFVEHKNEILVLMVMISRGDDYFLSFNNGEQIVNNWKQISLTANKIKGTNRKQVFLTPVLINAKGPKHYDKY
ncbi:MAG: hypothetical protein WC622_01660 [Pedobacter sp.]|jgi:hypothetical protein|uniref:hypothetical protein n=1 Tax=Pedobacter sp. TaxID=1411316 RepID=UPI00356AB5B3